MVKELVFQARESCRRWEPRRVLGRERHALKKRIWQLHAEWFRNWRWGDRLGSDCNYYYRKIIFYSYQIGKDPNV